MNSRFADTFFFVAVLSSRDRLHSKALDIINQLNSELVTTEWILVEVANSLKSANSRRLFVRLLDSLQRHPHITLIAADHEFFSRGMQLYSERIDKSWSLTDCISFIVMEDIGITEALTGDHHYEQAGF